MKVAKWAATLWCGLYAGGLIKLGAMTEPADTDTFACNANVTTYIW